MKTFYRRLKRRILSWLPRKCYSTIDDLPIKLWFDIASTGDVRLLKTKGNYTFDELEDVWTSIQQQYIDEFGLDSKYAKYLRLKKKLVVLELELIINEKLSLINNINILKEEMEMLSEGESRKFEEVIVLLERSFGIIIDPMGTSTKKYYYYLKNA